MIHGFMCLGCGQYTQSLAELWKHLEEVHLGDSKRAVLHRAPPR